MLSRRIVPCLDVRDGRVVKGVRFRDHIDCGDIVELARRYRNEGADELVFYDITASPEGRDVDVGWVERVARELDIPFCVAGGIRSVEQARRVLHAGADKVSINSPALQRPALIAELADAFGVQCVVLGVDSLRDDDGDWRVRSLSGDPSRMKAHAKPTLEWIAEGIALGAGEVKLTGMVRPDRRMLTYFVDFTKAIQTRRLTMGVADGRVEADGEVIYLVRDLKVALSAS